MASTLAPAITDDCLNFPTFWRSTKSILSIDAPIHFAIGVYLLLAYGLSLALDTPERFLPLSYVTAWTGSIVHMLMVILGTVVVARIRRDGFSGGLGAATAELFLQWRCRLFPALALCVSMSIFFGTFTSIKNMLPLIVPFWCDKLLADIGALLHGGRSPWFLLQPVLGYPPVTRAIEFLYAPVWFLMLTGFPVLLATLSDSDALRRRYFVAMLLCFTLLGNIVAGIAMSAGPIYYGAVTGDHDRYADILSYMRGGSGSQFSAWDLQQHLWTCWRLGAVELGSGISAFPSLHVAMATLFALAAARIDRRLGVAFGLYLGIILIGSVHLGWHYAIDGYFSIAATWAIWRLAGWLTSPRAHRCTGWFGDRASDSMPRYGGPHRHGVFTGAGAST